MRLHLRRTIALLTLTAAVACTTPSSGRSVKSAAKPSKEITLRVGLVFTTNGNGGELASAVLGAAKIAVDDVAAHNVKISLIPIDYGGDVNRLHREMTKRSASLDAVIIGTDDPSVLPALSSVTTIPLMHAFITSDDALRFHPNAFRLAPSNRLQAQRIARFLVRHRRYSRICVISDDTAFGKEGHADVTAALTAEGVAPLGEYRFTPGRDVHTPVAAAAQRETQACVVWVASPGEAARIVVDEHRSKYAYQLVLSGNLASPAFAKNAGSQVTPVAFREGMLSVGAWAGPWFRLERIVRFYRAFKTQNSALAPVQAASVYDAVSMLSSAALSKGTGGDALTRGLETLKDFEGAGVPITFAPGNHEGLEISGVAMYGFTKDQTAPGGEFAPDVDTGGGFFTVLDESLELPPRYAYLQNHA
ncbi:MAG: hypothetical protein NVSMB57_00340 [Actinomycetota bacterium]